MFFSDKSSNLWQYVGMQVLFDTHRQITHLQSNGFKKKQAEAVVDTINEIDLSHLATKEDLTKLSLQLTMRIGGMLALAVAFLSFLKLYG